MEIISDLQIHSKHSRATSRDISFENLEKYARIKGINLLGTGDFQHPLQFKTINEELKEDENGILWTKTGYPFIWQTEISLIYTQDGKGRRVHHLIFSPNKEVAKQIIGTLSKKGRLDYDGRPIFGFNSVELVDMMRDISKDIEIIPAHIWTTHFSLMGDYNKYSRVEDCFKDNTKYIHALETGMSSDPSMNWRLSCLDKFQLVSFSDSHSHWPWRLGREATIFDLKELTYENLIKAIRTGNGLTSTIETPPQYGKYHWDGHRNCNIRIDPEKVKDKICSVCGKQLTIGVLRRVNELADREYGFRPKNAKEFKRIIPLSEIISNVISKGIATKGVWDVYNKLIQTFGNEMNILLKVSKDDLLKVVDNKLVNAILLNREGKVEFSPGYDGEYGVPLFDKQKKLGEF